MNKPVFFNRNVPLDEFKDLFETKLVPVELGRHYLRPPQATMTSSWVAGTDVIRHVTVPGYDHDWAMVYGSIVTETVHIVPLIPHMDGVTQSILLLLVDHRNCTLDLVEVVYTEEPIHTLTGEDIIARVSAYLQAERENVLLLERVEADDGFTNWPDPDVFQIEGGTLSGLAHAIERGGNPMLAKHVRETLVGMQGDGNTDPTTMTWDATEYLRMWGSPASTVETGEPEGESQRHSLDDEVEPNSVTWALDDATVSAIAALLIEAHLPEDQGDD